MKKLGKTHTYANFPNKNFDTTWNILRYVNFITSRFKSVCLLFNHLRLLLRHPRRLCRLHLLQLSLLASPPFWAVRGDLKINRELLNCHGLVIKRTDLLFWRILVWPWQRSSFWSCPSVCPFPFSPDSDRLRRRLSHLSSPSSSTRLFRRPATFRTPISYPSSTVWTLRRTFLMILTSEIKIIKIDLWQTLIH